MRSLTVFERWAALVPGRLEQLRNDRAAVRITKMAGFSSLACRSAQNGVFNLRRDMLVASAMSRPKCRLPGTSADRLRAKREGLVRSQMKIGFRYAAQGHTTVIKLINDNAVQASLTVEVGRCYPYKGSRKTYPANTTEWTVRIPAGWHRRTDELGYIWVGDNRFVLDCSPRPAADGNEYFDAVTAVQGRGLEIRTETGIIAVDRDGGLVAFGTTVEATRRSLYATAAGKAVVAERREQARAAAETARQRAAREAEALAAQEAIAMTEFLFSLPLPKGLSAATHRAKAVMTKELVA